MYLILTPTSPILAYDLSNETNLSVTTTILNYIIIN